MEEPKIVEGSRRRYYRIRFFDERGWSGHENIFVRFHNIVSFMSLDELSTTLISSGFRIDRDSIGDPGTKQILPGAILSVEEVDERGFLLNNKREGS